MDFMKRHKIKLILLVVLLLFFIISFFTFLKLLYPDSRKDIYGNRLTGISDFKISNQVVTEIKDKVNSSGFVSNIEYLLKGKLIKFIIKVNADTKVSEAKKLVDNISGSFDDKTQSFYDIQVIIIEDTEESKNYPIFAYKHKTSDKFVWTNN